MGEDGPISLQNSCICGWRLTWCFQSWNAFRFSERRSLQYCLLKLKKYCLCPAFLANIISRQALAIENSMRNKELGLFFACSHVFLGATMQVNVSQSPRMLSLWFLLLASEFFRGGGSTVACVCSSRPLS